MLHDAASSPSRGCCATEVIMTLGGWLGTLAIATAKPLHTPCNVQLPSVGSVYVTGVTVPAIGCGRVGKWASSSLGTRRSLKHAIGSVPAKLLVMLVADAVGFNWHVIKKITCPTDCCL